MDSKEFRNLQEAYMEVVMNESYKERPVEKMKSKAMKIVDDPKYKGDTGTAWRHQQILKHATKSSKSREAAQKKSQRNTDKSYEREDERYESYDPKGQGKLLKKMQSLAKPDPDSTVKQNQKRRERSDKMYDKNFKSYVRPKGIPGGIGGPEWKSRQNKERGTQKEEYDIYDIVLSHLIDEGYAETPEAAEAIMVNMSEEWRNSIIG